MKPVAILSVDNTTHTKSQIGLQSAVDAPRALQRKGRIERPILLYVDQRNQKRYSAVTPMIEALARFWLPVLAVRTL